MKTLSTQHPQCQYNWYRIVIFSLFMLLAGFFSANVIGSTVNSIAIEGDNNYIFAGTDGGVFLSVDRGATWIARNNGLSGLGLTVNSLAIEGDNNYIFAGTDGGVFLSVDRGATWIARNNGLSGLGLTVNSLAIEGDNNYIFAGTDGGVFLSVDRGATWIARNNGLSGLGLTVNSLAIEGDNNYIFAGTDGGVFLSVDRGATWIARNNGLSGLGLTVNSLAIEGDNNYIFAGTDGGVFLSVDRGATWIARNNGLSGLGLTVNSLAIEGDNNYIFAGTDGGVFLSVDRGATWIARNNGLSGLGLTVNSLAIEGDNNYIFAGTDGGVFLSVDRGATWIARNNGLPYIAVTSPNGGENWLVGSSHNITWTSSGNSGNVKIEYSTNNGTNWTSIIASTPDDGSYTWTIPNAPSTSCLVRVSDTDGSPVDVSNSVFTISTGAGGACINETFTAASGTVTDNSGSSDYQNNMTCEKLIQPTGGGTITLTFTAFSTEASYDLVRVYAGSTTSAPLLGTFSGSSLPPVLTSSGGSMLIRFTTDGSVVAAGWSATYTSGPPPPTGCINETFTAATGTITDNSGSSDYQNNMTCEKLIQPTGGGAITLTFTAFNTEASYDFVRVYGGTTTSAPLLGTFSGSTLPPVLTSGAGSMLIRFTTDGSVVAAGWSATYTSGPPPPTGCINETFTTASGTITDNSGSSDYQNNMTCEKLIQPSGGGAITLTFTAFSTEASYDLVRVYAGSTTSAPLLGTFSGSTLPPVLTSSGGSMLIRFTTDGSVVAAGWSATYTSGPPPTGCINETFTTASGTITDNSGSSDYQNNMTCEKLIQPTGGGTITLTFTAFSTEASYDLVRVYAGSTTSAPLLGTFSGSTLPPVLTSSGGSMLIRFTSDASVVAAGWSATYTSGPPPPTGCINETFTAATGTITDNSGSSDYQNNMTCEKLIQPTGGGAITLTFTAFSTEASYDFVRVYGGTTTSAPLLGTFSGSSLPPVLTSSGGSMLIRFTTDGSVVAAGWSASYISGGSGVCTNETFFTPTGTVTDNSGSSDYQNNMTCEKLIQPTGGETVTLTFTSFSIESGYDLVRVYGGSTTSAPLLGTFSGSSLPPVLTSSGGSMLIRFTTDYSVVAAGWSATYTSSLTGGKGAEEISGQENLQDTKLVAYPNPTSGILTVESSFTEEETYTIELINASGQIMLNQKINVIGGKFDIDMSDVSSGLYLLQIRTGRTVQSIRVIKN